MHGTLALSRGGGSFLKRSSYYESDYRQSAALIRARRPYLVKNAVTGIAIAGFAIGVFAMTLKLVGQDKFEDVVVPSGASAGASASAGDSKQASV